jgi:hypothetical protein
LSLRRIDPRFTLPAAPKRAVVLGDLDEWRNGLPEVGVEVADAGTIRADLVVAPATLARAVAALEPTALIVEGRSDRILEAAGYDVRHFLPRPTLEEPSLLVPLEQPLAASYAVRHWSIVDRRWKRWRSRVAAALLERGRSIPWQPTLTVATRQAGAPYIVAAAAQQLQLPAPDQWVLTLGQGDALSRNVLHAFPPDDETPAWVVKFARVPGYAEPFDRDERGLGLAARAGEVVARRAPRLLGRFVVDSVHASVETAAVGIRLRELLQTPRSGDAARRLVDQVTGWILELGRATAEPPEALAEERRRLAEEVIPRWSAHGVTAALVSELPPLPAVTQHNDLGSWNVIVDGRSFTTLDWESARARGLPLWDLLYFLADALAVLDGAVRGEDRHEHTRRLFRGDLSSSEILFAWVRRAVAAFEVPHDSVGRIATLCWLHHSLSHVDRSDRRARLGDSSPPRAHGVERMAETWLSDPALGTSWVRWC